MICTESVALRKGLFQLTVPSLEYYIPPHIASVSNANPNLSVSKFQALVTHSFKVFVNRIVMGAIKYYKALYQRKKKKGSSSADPGGVLQEEGSEGRQHHFSSR